MLFNSLIFIFFALVFFSLWAVVKKHTQIRLIWITLASMFFYGWWDWRFLFLIIISGLIDYGAALFMTRHPNRRKLWLIFSITGNLLSLSIFKYSGFFAQNLSKLMALAGIHVDFLDAIPNFFLITPVGISFYTFQSMSYTLDVYRKEIKPTKNIWLFFAYLSMFPQLVAGPIVRAQSIIPQLVNPLKNKEEYWEGAKLIIKGYFKKMVIADNLAPLVVSAFSKADVVNSSNYWWGVIAAFAFQIYCDFSGYTDIARGLGKWMGLEIPINFNHPYLANSLKNFWQRWHISLSSWFRDYVYISLGGNRNGKFRSDVNMWITMLLSGLWHGANWTYVIWGAWHALFLSLERVLKKLFGPVFKSLQKISFLNTFGRVGSVLLVVIVSWTGWVFFRANSFNQAVKILKVMYSFHFTHAHVFNLNLWVYLGIMVFREITVALKIDRFWPYTKPSFSVVEAVFYGLLIAVIVFFRGNGAEFIYFQF